MSASELDSLHLADLHRLAAEHGVPRFRLLRRRELIKALQETDTDELAVVDESDEQAAGQAATRAPSRERERLGDGERRRSRGRGRGPDRDRARARDRGRERDRGRDREREGDEDEEHGEVPTEEVRGVLELTRQRYGFLRLGGLAGGEEDVYISAAQVRRCELRAGDEVAGPARARRRGERHRALIHVDSVNGQDPAESERPEFDSLEPELPSRRIELPADADVLTRAVDLLNPLAHGQRILVRAAPRSGRTTLLRGIAAAALAAGTRCVVLLVDERPEEASAWRRALPDAEFAIATAAEAPEAQVRTAELALERARRHVEAGADVVLVCDSLSRLAFAADGVAEVKRLFGSGRELSGDGSLTVVATTVEGGRDDGDAERAVITTESSLVTLDPDLAAAGVFPALDVEGCRISNEEALRDAAELEEARKLRAELADREPSDAAALLRERVEG